MTDRCSEVEGAALEDIGLVSTGGARDENFYLAAARISDETVASIEEMMGGEMPRDLRNILHLVIERSANLTGPQPVFVA